MLRDIRELLRPRLRPATPLDPRVRITYLRGGLADVEKMLQLLEDEGISDGVDFKASGFPLRERLFQLI